MSEFREVEAGEIFVKEQSLNALDEKTKQKYLSSIGYMDQFPSKYLFMTETVKHNLHYNLKLYNSSLRRQERVDLITEISRRLGFFDKLDRRLAVLSGGELRRVSFACAIISKPTILLCDEPTAQLDNLNKQALIDSVMDISSQYDTLIVIATHDQSLLKQGRVYGIFDRRIRHESG